ncbi:MAG: superoxide dismutase family protein [Clostridia bacterium]|nr:superoxide dismutase family protein [Clostridia bacterium]
MYQDQTKSSAVEPRIGEALGRRPQARAVILGNEQYPNIRGEIRFHQTPRGVLVIAEVRGLPQGIGACASPIFGFHIHEGGTCTPRDGENPFANTGMHDNPTNCPHPYHAGDLPPLFSANGFAFGACLTNRFTVNEIDGKTVVIHSAPDDFTTQPAGNSGTKIACGEIVGVT